MRHIENSYVCKTTCSGSTMTHLTTGQIAGEIEKSHGIKFPLWRMREVIDRLATSGAVTVTRVGPYRTLSPYDVLIVIAEFQKRNLLPKDAPATA